MAHTGDRGTRFLDLDDAIREVVHDGQTVALEGFTHLIPFAAGHEVIRQGIRGLTLARMTPDVIYDQMLGAGCADRLVFSWGGNPGAGSLYRFRDAIENGWPNPITIEEHTHAGMVNRYQAGASGLPFAVLRGYQGTDLTANTANVASVECPFTGATLTAVAALNPDVTIVHAQQADRHGNVQLWGILGCQKEALLAARTTVVTVEEIVDELDLRPGGLIIPAMTVSIVCHVPGGAAPSYAHGYYERDNAAYLRWGAVSRSREGFTQWLEGIRSTTPVTS